MTSCVENFLKKIRQDFQNRKVKQNKRWLRAIVESENRGGLTKDVEQALLKHMRKPEPEQKILPALSLRPDKQGSVPDQRRFLIRLEEERKAAIKAQGGTYEAYDWWPGAGNEAEMAMQKQRLVDLSADLEKLVMDDEAEEEEEEEEEAEEDDNEVEDEEEDEEDGGADLGASGQFDLPLRSKQG